MPDAAEKVSVSAAPWSVIVAVSRPPVETVGVVPADQPSQTVRGSTPLVASVSANVTVSPWPAVPSAPDRATAAARGAVLSRATVLVNGAAAEVLPAASRAVTVNAGVPSGALTRNSPLAVPDDVASGAVPAVPPATAQAAAVASDAGPASAKPLNTTRREPRHQSFTTVPAHVAVASPTVGAVRSTTAGTVAVAETLPARSTAATPTRA